MSNKMMASFANSKEIEDRIKKAGDQFELDVSRETLDKILGYVELLQKWNGTYNLTALRNLDDILINHIFDCMSVVPALRLKTTTDDFKLVDVGSGAGLPGIVLALWFPKAQVICIDSVEKKASFIRYVSGRIGCKNIEALHARVQDLHELNANFVISRAFSSLSNFSSLAGYHCTAGGLMVSMKSTQVNEDIADFESSDSDWKVESLSTLSVPESHANRHLVWLQRK